jgi:ABC-type uncharacterized transport system auxiliary subunit
VRGRRAAWGLLVLAAGCFGGAGPADHFYRLTAAPPAHPLAAPALSGTVEVERFLADGVIAERPLLFARRDAPSEIVQQRYHYWTDSPTSLLQEELVRYLREANAAGAVVMPQLGVRPDWTVRGRIVRFERLTGGGAPVAVVTLELSLVRAGGALVHAGTYRAERPVAGDGEQAVVDAFAAGVAEVYGRFLDDIEGARAAVTPGRGSAATPADRARPPRTRSRS